VIRHGVVGRVELEAVLRGDAARDGRLAGRAAAADPADVSFS
jgi:hypothetical protein